jgi:hypothetical protein
MSILLESICVADPGGTDYSAVESRYVAPERTSSAVSSIILHTQLVTELNVLMFGNITETSSKVDENELFKAVSFSAKETKMISPGILLEPGNVLMFTAASLLSNLSVHVFGLEISE